MDGTLPTMSGFGNFAPPPANTTGLPHDDAGPKLDVVVWTVTGLATIFLGLRVYCKFLGRRNLWWDDYILIGAWVMLLADAALTSVLVARGYGKHTWDLTPQQLASLSPIIIIRASFTIIAAAWSKTSFAITVLRIAEGGMRWLLWYIIVSVNLALGAAVLVGWIPCQPIAKIWDQSIPGTCWPIDSVAAVILFAGIYSGAMDIALALLPWKIIWGLQMKPREKFGVAVAMSMAILAGIMAFIKSYHVKALLSTDIYDTVELNIWDVAEGAVTIMAASIPVLRVLFREATSAATRRFQTNRTRVPDTPALKLASRDTIPDDHSDREVLVEKGGKM